MYMTCRDCIRELHQGMDSPPSSNAEHNISTATLVDIRLLHLNPIPSPWNNLKRPTSKLKMKRTQALEQVQKMEEQIQKANDTPKTKIDTSNMNHPNHSATEYFTQMLQVAEDQGNQAAFKWARAHIS